MRSFVRQSCVWNGSSVSKCYDKKSLQIVRPCTRSSQVKLWHVQGHVDATKRSVKPRTLAQRPLRSFSTQRDHTGKNETGDIKAGQVIDRSKESFTNVTNDLQDSDSIEATRVSNGRQRTDRLYETVGTAITEVSRTVNSATGYDEIVSLKDRVSSAESAYLQAQKVYDSSREHYDSHTNKLTSTQRSLNALLQRQSSWTSSDLAHFTELFRQDHEQSTAIKQAKQDMDASWKNVESARRNWMNVIRERYHEEQVWQDKIRYASTMWTWILIGCNFATLLAVTLVFEPRRRRKMVEHVDATVLSAEERLKNRLSDLEIVQLKNIRAIANFVPSRHAQEDATIYKESASKRNGWGLHFPVISITGLKQRIFHRKRSPTLYDGSVTVANNLINDPEIKPVERQNPHLSPLVRQVDVDLEIDRPGHFAIAAIVGASAVAAFCAMVNRGI